jgi:hypothetical protein
VRCAAAHFFCASCFFTILFCVPLFKLTFFLDLLLHLSVHKHQVQAGRQGTLDAFVAQPSQSQASGAVEKPSRCQAAPRAPESGAARGRDDSPLLTAFSKAGGAARAPPDPLALTSGLDEWLRDAPEASKGGSGIATTACPICGQRVLTGDADAHVNAHFDVDGASAAPWETPSGAPASKRRYDTGGARSTVGSASSGAGSRRTIDSFFKKPR